MASSKVLAIGKGSWEFVDARNDLFVTCVMEVKEKITVTRQSLTNLLEKKQVSHAFIQSCLLNLSPLDRVSVAKFFARVEEGPLFKVLWESEHRTESQTSMENATPRDTFVVCLHSGEFVYCSTFGKTSDKEGYVMVTNPSKASEEVDVLSEHPQACVMCILPFSEPYTCFAINKK